jgi:serine phosphatase RsbU (regulator of sigma subunit)
MILGPDPAASYKLGFAHLDRGSAMVLYSDGVVERETGPGAPFGEERLRDWLAAWRQGPADVAVADLFARLGAVDGQAFDDDVTVMLVRRPR